MGVMQAPGGILLHGYIFCGVLPTYIAYPTLDACFIGVTVKVAASMVPVSYVCCIVGMGSDDDVLTTGSEGSKLCFSYIAALSKQFTTLIKAYRMYANLLLTILLDILSKWQD